MPVKYKKGSNPKSKQALLDYWATHKKTPEHIEKIRQANANRKKICFCENCGEVIGVGSRKFNRRYCDKCAKSCKNKNYGKSKWGKNNPQYKDGLAAKASRWSKAVKTRDNYTCQLCGLQIIEKGTRRKCIHSHHIKPREDFPELQYDVDNGITLCNVCHFQVERFTDNLELKLENKRLNDKIKELSDRILILEKGE